MFGSGWSMSGSVRVAWFGTCLAHASTSFLNGCIVWQWIKSLDFVILCINGASSPWHLRLAFELDKFSLLAGLSALAGVLLDALKKVLATFAVADMLNTQINALLDIAVPNNLVDNNADASLCHIKHDTGPSVIVLVRHTFLYCAIALDVHNISDLVCLHVR